MSRKVKNKGSKKNQPTKSTNAAPRRATPFADAGQIVASKTSKFFGLPDLGAVGKFLGSGIGSIFGSGDYTAVNGAPSYNVFSGNTPQFKTNQRANIVCHREYLGDITGTASFTNTTYRLNPGDPATFPWLSSIASGYQEYKLHGMIIEFRSLLTDYVTAGSPGRIVMTTNYNADATAFTSLIQAENTEFAVGVKPTQSLIHMVECNPSETTQYTQLVRPGGIAPASGTYKTTDHGLFQFITSGNPVQTIGELWVSYCVEFLKPVQSYPLLASAHMYFANTNGAMFVATPSINVGNLGMTVKAASNEIDFVSIPGNLYMIQFNMVGSGAVALSMTFGAIGGATSVPLYGNDSLTWVQTPANATNTASVSWTAFVRATGPSVAYQWAPTTIPTGATSYSDVLVTDISPNVTS